MMNSFYLAFQYVSFYKWRSLLLILSMGIIIFLPFGLRHLINESERQMMERANATPLIIGAKGSASDLVINSLYFQQEPVESITMREVEVLKKTGFGYAIPMYTVFQARQHSIVGISLEYFDFRNLHIDEGRLFGLIGECILGNDVAKKLNLSTGDFIVSSPENYFELSGVYPLKMRIVGILEIANTSDDQAIFTSLKTTWVIQGLGHGHEDLEIVSDPSIIMNSNETNITATSKLKIYQEINSDNSDKIHFHGDPSDYPISSMIYVPNDEKSGTMLRGKFEAGELPHQISAPSKVIETLLQRIFRIKKIFDLMFLLVGIATLFIFLLVVGLSLRLRKEEINTLIILGSSRAKVIQILCSEIITILLLSGFVAITLYGATGFFVEDFINNFILT